MVSWLLYFLLVCMCNNYRGASYILLFVFNEWNTAEKKQQLIGHFAFQ